MAGRAYASAAEPFDPARLARIVASLERHGVTFVLDEDGAALAAAVGAEAFYWPEAGRPGFVAFGPAPTCSAVIEELYHLGQHRRSGWANLEGRIAELEIEAQLYLWKLSVRWDWPDDDKRDFWRAKDRWRRRYYEREDPYRD